ncbi:tyrosine-type recombinase/integrase [Nocardioides nitrophenolicus]|uniref:tyrosine-type recombinase/integrase n=1 Tax=Nocardioides nitrophenolicus TaxID=60489 RepID=UPI00195ED668|nr:site-specific integrase [Nocardioides nitrophenolicus]MBM7519176.1 integrase [Nocardioides nitrophenolicus]
MDAQAFLDDVSSDMRRGRYIDVDAGKVSLRDYSAQWLSAQTFSETTYSLVEQRLRLHVYPRLGDRQLRQLTPSVIQAWLKGLSDLAPKYQKDIFGHLSAILTAAVDDEKITKNPCKAQSVKRPKLEPRKVVPWTRDQVVAVRDALPDQYQIMATLAAGLGLRQGEVFGLSPDDIDFLRGTVTIRRQVKLFVKNKAFAPPKAGRTREIPLPSTVRDALAAHLAAHPAQTVTLPWKTLGGEAVPVSLVVTRHGEAMGRNWVNSYLWGPALDKAEVPRGRDNGMHALRHFYASVLLDAGENIKALSSYLGHADPGFTLRTYTHLMPSSTERTRQAIDGALKGQDPASTSETGS